jgi:protein-tyrosine phosphatase
MYILLLSESDVQVEVEKTLARERLEEIMGIEASEYYSYFGFLLRDADKSENAVLFDFCKTCNVSATSVTILGENYMNKEKKIWQVFSKNSKTITGCFYCVVCEDTRTAALNRIPRDKLGDFPLYLGAIDAASVDEMVDACRDKLQIDLMLELDLVICRVIDTDQTDELASNTDFTCFVNVRSASRFDYVVIEAPEDIAHSIFDYKFGKSIFDGFAGAGEPDLNGIDSKKVIQEMIRIGIIEKADKETTLVIDSDTVTGLIEFINKGDRKLEEYGKKISVSPYIVDKITGILKPNPNHVKANGKNSLAEVPKKIEPPCHNGDTLAIKLGKLSIYCGGSSRGGGFTPVKLVVDLKGSELQVVRVFGGDPDWEAVGHLVKDNHVISINWPDYDVPNLGKKFWQAFVATLLKKSAKTEYSIYVGCLGGHGRTGTAMAIIAHLLGICKNEDPVTFIRNKHCKNAVESERQLKYIEKICGISLPKEAKIIHKTSGVQHNFPNWGAV